MEALLNKRVMGKFRYKDYVFKRNTRRNGYRERKKKKGRKVRIIFVFVLGERDKEGEGGKGIFVR